MCENDSQRLSYSFFWRAMVAFSWRMRFLRFQRARSFAANVGW
jgi:hypothetical protein